MSGSPRRVADKVSGAAASASSAGPSNAAVADMFNELLRRTHLGGPSEMAAVIAEPARRIGARGVVPYLIDYEQRLLVPVAPPGTIRMPFRFRSRGRSPAGPSPPPRSCGPQWRRRAGSDAIVDRQPGQLKDDATAVLVEWRRGAEVDLLPQTAP